MKYLQFYSHRRESCRMWSNIPLWSLWGSFKATHKQDRWSLCLASCFSFWLCLIGCLHHDFSGNIFLAKYCRNSSCMLMLLPLGLTSTSQWSLKACAVWSVSLSHVPNILAAFMHWKLILQFLDFYWIVTYMRLTIFRLLQQFTVTFCTDWQVSLLNVRFHICSHRQPCQIHL